MGNLPCGKSGECSDCTEDRCETKEKEWRKWNCAPITTDILEKLSYVPALSASFEEIQGFVDMGPHEDEWIWDFPIPKKELFVLLPTLINQLEDPHRTILQLRYPTNGDEAYGQKAIGVTLNMSRQLVNYHLKQAQKKIKQLLLNEIEERASASISLQHI